MAMAYSTSVVVKKYGNYNSTVVEQFPLPPIEGRIEVEVHYCGMNFSDLYMRLGFFDKKLPFILGSECAGVITYLGLKTDLFHVGQRVICYDYMGGMYSTTVRVLPNQVFALPDYVPFDIGAAIFVNYLTAYFAVYELGSLQPGDTILINSCAGGVGWAATQLSRQIKNIKIYGTTSPLKEYSVQENGVNIVIGYENLINEIKVLEPMGVDIIIENQSGNTIHENMCLLRPLGRMVLIGVNTAIRDNQLSYYALLKLWWKSWWFSLTDMVINNRSISGLHLGTLLEKDREKVLHALDLIFKLFRDDKIRPEIDSVWPMEKFSDATKRLADRKNIGKVLIKVTAQD